MRPEDVKPGLRLWMRYIHNGLRTVLVEVTAVINLPDVPQAWATAILAYLALKVAQFAKEHL